MATPHPSLASPLRVARATSFLAALMFVLASCISPSPTQATVVKVSGVVLVPPDALRESCVRAAAIAGFAVPCPRLIIQHRGAVGEGCPMQDLLLYAGGKDCLEDSAAGDPAKPSRRDAFTYVENDIVMEGAVHLFIVGVRNDSRLLAARTGCVGPETTESAPSIDGVAATWVECPDGSSMNSGHVLLRWNASTVAYAVSLHGHTQRNRDVELTIARNIEYVHP